MSSKKTKSTKETKGSKKSPRKKSNEYELVAPECWINELAGIDIEEKNWKCTVIIIEEESTDLAVYMEHFNDSAKNGSRLSIKSISKLDVIQHVIKNMTESHPGVRVTPLSLLCSEIFRLVGPEFKSQIPTHLLASILKYLIIEYKDLNKKIWGEMEQRKKDFEEYHKSLWQTPNMKTSSLKGNQSSKLEKKSDKMAKVANNKPLTKLRKRGEEWKDKSWIDDSPPDGPQLYIAISTFFDPDLPLQLLQLNIPLHAIVKVSFWNDSKKRSDTSTTPTDLKSVFQSLQYFRHKSTPHLQSSVLKRGSDTTEVFENSTMRISRFWKQINILKNELPTALLFKDVMFLNFIPLHTLFEYHIKSFQEEIYKQISYFMYDVYAITKQHTQYISEINLKNVSEIEPCKLSSMTVYQSLLDNVPHETVDIPFLLDAIIIQTCSLEKKSDRTYGIQEFDVTVETPIQTSIGENLNKLLKQLNFRYDLCNKPLSFAASHVEQSNNYNDNCKIKHVLQHFDERHKKTFHLQEDIANFLRERTTLILNVAWNKILFDNYYTSHYDGNIVKLCNDIIETAEQSNQHILKHYIYLLIVNKILNSLILHDFFDSTIKTNSLKETILHSDKENLCEDCILELESNAFSIAPFLRNSMSSPSTSSSNISTNSLKSEIIACNLFYLEDMTADVMVQWIQKTWSNFNKLETSLCPFTNQVVMVFHNLLSPKVGVFEENWMGKLTTLVPIRDFVDYILEEENDWLTEIQNDLMNESSNIDTKVGFSFDTQLAYDLNLIFPEDQFISHRSLKYETLSKKQKFEKQYKDLPTGKSKSSTKTTSKQPDSLKKPKKVETQKDKYIHEPIKASVHNLEELKEDFKFIGYDLGEPKRFQFSGSRKEKVLDSCCKIALQTINKLYGEKSQLLMVTISDHTLYYSFKPYCETTLNSPFHLVLSSGIILYFGSSNEGMREKEHTILLPKAYNRTSSTETSFVNNTVLSTIISQQHTITMLEAKKEFGGSNDFTPNMTKLSSCFPHSIKKIPYFEIPLLFDLVMSLPNGLHIELAKVESLFYIRQKHLSRSAVTKRVEKEEYRCCLSNGYIIKFFSNKEMEILSANGAIFRVFAIKEVVVNSQIEEPMRYTEDTSAKTAFSDISIKKTKRASLKEKTDETSKHSKVKKSSKSTNSIFSKELSTINIEEQKPQEVLRNFTNRHQVVDYECTTAEGKRFKIQNNQTKEVFQDLLIIDTTDIENNCIFSERSDNVSMKHLAGGSLSVQYTDGSRITSTPVEAGEVFCEWSPEELELWFSLSTESINDFVDFEKSFINENKTNFTKNSALSRQIDNHLISLESMNTDDITKMEENLQTDEETAHVSVLEEGRTKSYSNTSITKISSDLTRRQDENTHTKMLYQEDGFVVYHVSYLMEHPNYSAVYYNANTCDVELKLPLNNNVVLKNDGCYEAHFDGATLTVDNDDIYFSKTSESKNVERTVIINNSTTANKNPINFTNYFNHNNSLPLSVDEFCQSIGIKSIFRGMVKETEIKSGLLLYCVDEISNEIIVDYDFNFYELPATKDDKYLKADNSFTCAVINEDLSGFRLVTEYEVERYIQFITESQGLVKENDNVWKSLITTKPVFTNESEKWLTNYHENLIQKSKPTVEISTYGKKESWIQPFVTIAEKEQDLNAQEAVEIRIFHKIPTEKTILDQLKSVFTTFNKKTEKKDIQRVFLNEDRKEFTTEKFVKYPKLLCELITDEKNKKKKENDTFRTAIELTFLHSLINKAIIKARKIRQQNKREELKLALRRKEVPPYHMNGFGYIHSILDEVIENITVDDEISLSVCSNCEKVNFIIDELLSVVTTKNYSESKAINRNITITDDNDSGGIKSIISTIFRNACAVSKENYVQNYINAVMEKPLKLITSEEIEFLSKMFGSGYCPIFQDEEFILQDVLNAGFQLSNYFKNLRSMLEFHRSPEQATLVNKYKNTIQ